MALAGRSTRRGAGARWLAIGIVVTLIVLFVDAAVHSSSPRQAQDLAAGAWVDRVLPVIAASNAQGDELAQLWSSGLSMKPAQVLGEVDQLASGAETAYRQVVALRPPAALAGAAGLLEACLLARSDATAAIQSAFRQVLAAAGIAVVPTGGLRRRGPASAGLRRRGPASAGPILPNLPRKSKPPAKTCRFPIRPTSCSRAVCPRWLRE